MVLLPVPGIGSVIGSASGSLPQVVMMQTAQLRHLDHLPTLRGLQRPRDWTVMLEGAMRADFVVIHRTRMRGLPQVGLTDHIRRMS